MWETWVRSLGWEDPLEKEMATHSSILACRIPWTEEPGETRLSNFPHFTLSDSNVGAFMLHFLYTFLDHVRPLKRILVK